MGDALDTIVPGSGSGGSRRRARARRAVLSGVAAVAVLPVLPPTAAQAVSSPKAPSPEASAARASAPRAESPRGRSPEAATPTARPPKAPSLKAPSLTTGSSATGQKFSPPPAGPWPKGGTFSVFLCWDDAPWENCHGRAVTAEQRRALGERLRAMPQVKDVRFVSRQEALADYRRAYAGDEVMLSVLKAGDLPESFVGTLRDRADIAPFPAALNRAPGVANAGAFGHPFWRYKADAYLTLCGADDCAGRGRATSQERKAVEARLAGMEEVEHVYVEDAAHARRVLSFMWAGRLPDSAAVSEGYFVKLADPTDARSFAATMEELPGVGGAGVVETG
ncbi:permease-like cell division protein FtsX [Streptosporangium jomthongense]|uniref:Permease-like cell division protein FtsX n=1 Tax=Streptosporangium jomthongense TaxID=1193683 RepID=A0ABV8F5Q5_9ACTN